MVGTQAEIERYLDLPLDERMPSWNGLCSDITGETQMAEQRTLVMYANCIALSIRDGLDPKAVHEAFLPINEYRRHLAADVPGVGRYPNRVTV